MLCFYELLRYLTSIAILTTTRDHTSASPKTKPFIDPNHTTQQTTNPLIGLFLSGSPHWVWLRLFGAQTFPPTRTINIPHQTYQQKVQLLTSLAMTQFGPSIEPITSPTLSGYTTCYTMEADKFYKIYPLFYNIFRYSFIHVYYF